MRLFQTLSFAASKPGGLISKSLRHVKGVTIPKWWTSHGRICTPRLIFYFSKCPLDLRGSKGTTEIIKKSGKLAKHPVSLENECHLLSNIPHLIQENKCNHEYLYHSNFSPSEDLNFQLKIKFIEFSKGLRLPITPATSLVYQLKTITFSSTIKENKLSVDRTMLHLKHFSNLWKTVRSLMSTQISTVRISCRISIIKMLKKPMKKIEAEVSAHFSQIIWTQCHKGGQTTLTGQSIPRNSQQVIIGTEE